MSKKRHLDTTKANPRARERILTGDEPGDRSVNFDDYVVEWCGWRAADFAAAYSKKGSPMADWMVRVITSDGHEYVRVGRYYARSVGATVGAEIGPHASTAFYRRAGDDGSVVPLDAVTEAELLAFIGAFVDNADLHS